MMRAIDTVHTAEFGTIEAGTELPSTHPFCIANPALFKRVAAIEEATARPGASRPVKRSK